MEAQPRQLERPRRGDGAWHRAHPRADQLGAAQQRIPRVCPRALDARPHRTPGARAHRRDDRRTAARETVNFETLELETATAIRQFALIAQIQKHVDRDTPIRFLIAECEMPGNGADRGLLRQALRCQHIVDISPLFETPSGLESGARLVERLLEEDAYKDYVTKRGRLSHPDRLLGRRPLRRPDCRDPRDRAPAQWYCRPRRKVRIEQRRDADLFDTRRVDGPRRTPRRSAATPALCLLRTKPPQLRRATDWPLKHETSFQGSDGYLFFGNRALTTRALATIIMDGDEPGPGE